jgi:hypothetical protein
MRQSSRRFFGASALDKATTRKENRHAEARLADDAPHWNATMTFPNYVNEIMADIRCIKPGWYATDDVGKISAGPFRSHEDCLGHITLPTYESILSK